MTSPDEKTNFIKNKTWKFSMMQINHRAGPLFLRGSYHALDWVVGRQFEFDLLYCEVSFMFSFSFLFLISIF